MRALKLFQSRRLVEAALLCLGCILVTRVALAGGGVPIEFSAPKSDLVISNLFEKNSSSSRGPLRDLEDEVLAPFSFPGSGGAPTPGLNIPARMPATIIPSRRDSKLEDERRNWIFMDPDEYVRKMGERDDITAPEFESEDSNQRDLSVIERYFLNSNAQADKREDAASVFNKAATSIYEEVMAAHRTDSKDQGFNQPLNSFVPEIAPAYSAYSAQPEYDLDATLPGIAPARARSGLGKNSWQDNNGVSVGVWNDMVQQERLESFRQLLRPDQPDATTASIVPNSVDVFRNQLNPQSASSALDQLQTPGLNYPSTSLSTPGTEPSGLAGQPSELTAFPGISSSGSSGTTDPFNSDFKVRDPFQSEALKDPNSGAFGETETRLESQYSEPRRPYAPLVLPRPKRGI